MGCRGVIPQSGAPKSVAWEVIENAVKPSRRRVGHNWRGAGQEPKPHTP
jgi:hypothetical protein